MDQKSLKKLEYDKIIAKVAGYCRFAVSREQAQALQPTGDAAYAAGLLAETEEARQILRLHPTFSLGGLWDIRPSLRHLEIGGVLEPEALVNLAAICRSARLAKAFFSELKGGHPTMQGLGKSLTIIKTIESAVEKAIGADLGINDGASERLAGIRRKNRDKSERIKERLDSLIKNPNTAKYLQDPIVTIRDNRYVVPVRQEYRGQIAGVAHDISSSGATLFIEPLAVLELNNELSVLRREEEEEIAAILRALSLVAAGFLAELQANLEILARLDFIFAKGSYSYELDGIAPRIDANGNFRLLAARHPLIPAHQVVPIEVRLERNTSAMVITGPNTGGKTVTLKTIGLLTCMALSGLHIPAEGGSEIGCYNAVWADIGDEQSIEQSLSTFSSHMSNIVIILGQAGPRSLVLLDELGAGTDPTEGAALAMAILEYLKNAGARVVATTHYSELKAFAYNNPGFINASMEFDLATLSPTYRLIMGAPGKSNAFEISRRLGLPEPVIKAAEAGLSSEDAAVAAMLANLEDARRDLTAQREKVEKAAIFAQSKEQYLRRETQKLEAEKSEIIRGANLEAQKIVEQVRAECKALLAEQQKAAEEKKLNHKAWQEAQKKLKSWQQQLAEEIPEPVFAGQAPDSLQSGDYVHLPRLNQYGYVVSTPDADGDVFVQVGVIKLKAKLAELRLAAEEKPKKSGRNKSSGAGGIAMRKASSIMPYLDLHGLDTMEALPVLDKYIDDAFIAGLKTVEINHGRGTGALRSFVQNYLRGHRLVKSFHNAASNEGGLGVTVVDLDL
ncbi:MAG: endonuclease MutS2 [Clostridia bacterium]|nr:endonuclease MutS2 [Clostridia bacterium]